MAKKEEVKVEKTEKIIEEKDGVNVGAILKIVWNIIFWAAFAAFVITAIAAYMNFRSVEEDEEPSFYADKEEYKTDAGNNVTVYDYYIYKIVEEYNESGRSVSLKLWFLDDVNEDEE